MILGQGAVNLGVTSSSLQNELNKVKENSASKIIRLNDSTKLPYQDLVKEARKILKGYEDRTMMLETKFYHSVISKA